MDTYETVLKCLDAIDRYEVAEADQIIAEIESELEELRVKEDASQQDRERMAELDIALATLNANYFMAYDKRFNPITVEKTFKNVIGKVEEEKKELLLPYSSVDKKLMIKFYYHHYALYDNRDLPSYCKEWYEKFMETYNSIEEVSMEILENRICLMVLVMDILYEIFDKSGISYYECMRELVSKISGKEVPKDETDFSKHIPEEYHLAKYELKIRKFYDDRDVFKNLDEENNTEIKSILANKPSVHNMVVYKGPLLLMRPTYQDKYAEELDFFKENALKLVKTEEEFEKSNFKTTYDIAMIDYDLAKHEKINNNRLKNYQNMNLIKDSYNRIKSLEYNLDIKYWDMLFFIKTIIMIKLQEVNQDDVYEIYIYYDKAFKLSTDEDKVSLNFEHKFTYFLKFKNKRKSKFMPNSVTNNDYMINLKDYFIKFL